METSASVAASVTALADWMRVAFILALVLSFSGLVSPAANSDAAFQGELDGRPTPRSLILLENPLGIQTYQSFAGANASAQRRVLDSPLFGNKADELLTSEEWARARPTLQSSYSRLFSARPEAMGLLRLDGTVPTSLTLQSLEAFGLVGPLDSNETLTFSLGAKLAFAKRAAERHVLTINISSRPSSWFSAFNSSDLGIIRGPRFIIEAIDVHPNNGTTFEIKGGRFAPVIPSNATQVEIHYREPKVATPQPSPLATLTVLLLSVLAKSYRPPPRKG